MTIRAIARSTVERIASGQVIVDLSSAIKELIENSIDASATTIGTMTISVYQSLRDYVRRDYLDRGGLGGL